MALPDFQPVSVRAVRPMTANRELKAADAANGQPFPYRPNPKGLVFWPLGVFVRTPGSLEVASALCTGVFAFLVAAGCG
jgi:hypothetical protein